MPMSAYLRDLRAKVGNELLLLPAVAVFVVDENASALLLCRNAGQTHWEAIGGMVEPHEHPLTAAQRELHEEAGLLVEAKDLLLLGVVGGPQYLVTYPNGHQVSYVTSVYRVVRNDAQPVADGDEITAVGWHPLSVFSMIGYSDPLRPDPALYGLFVRSLLAEFGPRL